MYLVLLLATDYIYYDRVIFTPLEFLRFNVYDPAAAYFGEEGFVDLLLAYIGLFGLPSILIPLFFVSDFKYVEISYHAIIYYTVHALFVKHKEQRFLLPIIPTSSIMAGRVLGALTCKKNGDQRKRKLIMNIFYTSSLLNVLLSACASRFNKIHYVQLSKFLRRDIQAYEHVLGTNEYYNMLHLAPCYHFPAYCLLRKDVYMRMLECRPDLRFVEVNSPRIRASNTSTVTEQTPATSMRLHCSKTQRILQSISANMCVPMIPIMKFTRTRSCADMPGILPST